MSIWSPGKDLEVGYVASYLVIIPIGQDINPIAALVADTVPRNYIYIRLIPLSHN